MRERVGEGLKVMRTKQNYLRSEYMSRIPRHVSSRVYVSHSETCKQPSVDLVHISETLTRKFFQLLKQRSKKEKASFSQPFRFIALA